MRSVSNEYREYERFGSETTSSTFSVNFRSDELLISGSESPLQEHASICCCPACGGNFREYSEFNLTTTPLYTLDPSNPISGDVGTNAANGKPILSAYQVAQQLNREAADWTEVNDSLIVTYSFLTGGIFASFEANAAEKIAFVQALDFYSDISGLTFVEVPYGANTADFHLQVHPDGSGGGYATYPDPRQGTVEVGRYSVDLSPLPGHYFYFVVLHELGHALGIAHGGAYNGSAT